MEQFGKNSCVYFRAKFLFEGEVFLNFSTFCWYFDFLSIVSLINIQLWAGKAYQKHASSLFMPLIHKNKK